jgi:large subunit ribosomal protein L11
MGETTVQGLVEGGKATSGPPFGPALGPLGVNINAIVAEINEKTKQFAGIKIPVKVHVDAATKAFRVEIGAPTTSAMLLKELGISAGTKGKGEIVGNITLDKVKQIAKSKEGSLYGKGMGNRINQILGTCKSMGITCDGEDPRLVIKKISSNEIKL